MSGITPISGISGGIRPVAAPPAAPQAKSPQKTGFSHVLQDFVQGVNQGQHASASAIRDLVSGRTEDILPAVQAVAKADLSFKLLIGVRNKVIEAYKQTMNMQI